MGERVGEHDTAEWFVATGALPVALFDLDGGQVVGEQHDLVGVDLLDAAARYQRVVRVDELALQVFVCDQWLAVAVLLGEQTVDERARAREGVQDVDIFRGQSSSELLAQHSVDRPQHEVDEFHRRVDDPQPSDLGGHGLLEKRLVHLQHDLESGIGVGRAREAVADAVVEPVQCDRLVAKPDVGSLELVKQFVQGGGDRVAVGETAACEERIEDGHRDHMLCDEHRKVARRQASADGGFHLVAEALELGGQVRVGPDSGPHMLSDGAGDPRHLTAPAVPVLTIAAGGHQP